MMIVTKVNASQNDIDYVIRRARSSAADCTGGGPFDLKDSAAFPYKASGSDVKTPREGHPSRTHTP